MKQFTLDVEKLEDAASELMMVTDDKCMLFIGESFIECSEEYATEYCENKAEVRMGHEIHIELNYQVSMHISCCTECLTFCSTLF